VISPTDPAARYTASANSVAGYAYSDNYLVDLKHAVVVDVEATTTIRQAEVGATKTMLDRTAEQFDLTPSRLVADGGYGSVDMVGRQVDERGIEQHVNLIDKSERTDGTFSREPTSHSIPNATSMSVPEVRSCENIAARSPCRAKASQRTARSAIAPLNTTATPACSNPSAVRICPHARSCDPFMKPLVTRPVRSPRLRLTPSHVANEKRSVEMLFAHLKRIFRLDRLRLRGPNGAKDEFLLAATAQNLRKLAKLISHPAPIFAT
jgi:hypothetical protein